MPMIAYPIVYKVLYLLGPRLCRISSTNSMFILVWPEDMTWDFLVNPGP